MQTYDCISDSLNEQWNLQINQSQANLMGVEAMNCFKLIYTSLDKLHKIFNILVEKLEQTELQKTEERIAQSQKLTLAKQMLEAKQAQILELKDQTSNLRKQQDEIEKQIIRNDQQMNNDQEQQYYVKEKENEQQKQINKEESENLLHQDENNVEKQMQLILSKIPGIQVRRYPQDKAPNQSDILKRSDQTDYSQMEEAIKQYRSNQPRNFITEHLSTVRDIAFHPQLMLLASASDDGTLSFVDVSHSIIKNKQADLQQTSLLSSVAQSQSLLTANSQSQQQHNLTPSDNTSTIQVSSSPISNTSNDSSSSSSSISLLSTSQQIKLLDINWSFKPS